VGVVVIFDRGHGTRRGARSGDEQRLEPAEAQGARMDGQGARWV
jgi:hypothetical protein